MKKKNTMVKKKGFTLVELVAVVAIIGILAAILVPKVTSYMNEAKKVKVLDQARKVITAIESYDMKNDTNTRKDKASTTITKLLTENASISAFVDGETTKLGSATVQNVYDIVENKADFKIDSTGAFNGMVVNTSQTP